MNIIGNLTRNAEVKQTPNGKEYITFDLALNQGYYSKEKGQRVDKTVFIRCVYWISTKVAAILNKGNVVEVTGSLDSRAWQGRDGNLKSQIEVNVSTIKLHGKLNREEETPINTQVNQAFENDFEFEDLPF